MPYLFLGEFYSEFGTFDVRITLPREYMIMATGDLPEGDPEYTFLDSLVTVTRGITSRRVPVCDRQISLHPVPRPGGST